MARNRKDGKLLRNIDGMHFITPIIYPRRCDNEAFIYEKIDLSKVDKYLAKKNKDNDDYKYNLFQIIVTAVLKILYQREKMNYFVANSNLYERYEKTAAFVVKKEFSDKGKEGLAIIKSKGSYNIDDIHELIKKEVYEQRSGKEDSSSTFMEIFKRIPRVLSKFLVRIIMVLDNFGLVPQALIESDPYYSSCVLTNLGSIGLHAGYHHLTNWGTNSLFVAIGQIQKRPFFQEDGKILMKNSIDIGLTIDERIADGYYYAKTVELLKYILENPELLELPLNEEIKQCQNKLSKNKKTNKQK